MPESVLWDNENHRNRVLAQSNPAVIIQVKCLDVGFFQLAYSNVEIHVIEIRILPEWQCMGIGSTLIMSIQDLCAKSKIPIGLHVSKNNRAFRLYDRLGFKVVKSDASAYFMRWSP